MELKNSHPSAAGPSILDLLWIELDAAYVELKAAIRRNGDNEWVERERGVCTGLATAISIVYNPYSPSLDTVRAEVVERYNKKES